MHTIELNPATHAPNARRPFNLTADEFLRIVQDPPEQYHGDPVFNSLCFLADLLAEPSDAWQPPDGRPNRAPSPTRQCSGVASLVSALVLRLPAGGP